MRDSILRVIDDLETRKTQCDSLSNEREDISHKKFLRGSYRTFEYVIQELRKVLDDHGQS